MAAPPTAIQADRRLLAEIDHPHPEVRARGTEAFERALDRARAPGVHLRRVRVCH